MRRTARGLDSFSQLVKRQKKNRNHKEPTHGARSRVTVADAQSRETSAATFRGNIMRGKPDYRVETPFLTLL